MHRSCSPLAAHRLNHLRNAQCRCGTERARESEICFPGQFEVQSVHSTRTSFDHFQDGRQRPRITRAPTPELLCGPEALPPCRLRAKPDEARPWQVARSHKAGGSRPPVFHKPDHSTAKQEPQFQPRIRVSSYQIGRTKWVAEPAMRRTECRKWRDLMFVDRFVAWAVCPRIKTTCAISSYGSAERDFQRRRGARLELSPLNLGRPLIRPFVNSFTDRGSRRVPQRGQAQIAPTLRGLTKSAVNVTGWHSISFDLKSPWRKLRSSSSTRSRTCR